MKNCLNIFLSLFPLFIIAQTGNVGIATTLPRTALDVNGTVNVNNEINLGGTNNNAGNPGSAGDLVSANGGQNPQWRKFDLPSGYMDGLVLSGTYLKSTTTGVAFDGTNNSANLSVAYDKGIDLPSNWKEVTGVSEQNIKINKSTNIVTIFVQTVAQVTGSSGTASYGCGIYVDDKLQFVRTGIVAGASGSYRILNLNASLPNLSVGNHTFKFACAERLVATGERLTIGEAQSGTNALSPTMAGTSATIKVLEPIQ